MVAWFKVQLLAPQLIAQTGETRDGITKAFVLCVVLLVRLKSARDLRPCGVAFPALSLAYGHSQVARDSLDCLVK
jgi:hypothetical protein